MNFRYVTLMYPEHNRGLRDVLLARSGVASASLDGVEVPGNRINDLMSREKALWLVTGPGRSAKAIAHDRIKIATLTACFTLQRTWPVKAFLVQSYARRMPWPNGCSWPGWASASTVFRVPDSTVPVPMPPVTARAHRPKE
jgi:hypothetical protein